jgi:hypothetical protein
MPTAARVNEYNTHPTNLELEETSILGFGSRILYGAPQTRQKDGQTQYPTL